MLVVSLHTYPVKGCHGLDHDAAEVATGGLDGDRRWMLVEPDGLTPVTQREIPALVGVRPVTTDGGLRLSAPGMPDLDVPAPAIGAVEVAFWGNPVTALAAGEAADDWCSAALDHRVRLVYCAEPRPRVAGDDPIAFPDGTPVLLASTASLDALNDWIMADGDESVPMTRFRPNIVVDGEQPWAEDGWGRLSVGPVEFRVLGPCVRCVVTTTDQERGVRGREPLRTLGRRRRLPGGLMFAVGLAPDSAGRIAVGDRVTVRA